MKKIIIFSILSASLFSNAVSAQMFKYKCGSHDLTMMLSPNAAYLDGKPFEYKSGETNGEVTKMTFFGDGAQILKFLADPASNSYHYGLSQGGSFEEETCTEVE